jgi:hypothetical protein
MSSIREVSACYLACMRGSNCKNHLSKVKYYVQPTVTAMLVSLSMDAIHLKADVVHSIPKRGRSTASRLRCRLNLQHYPTDTADELVVYQKDSS